MWSCPLPHRRKMGSFCSLPSKHKSSSRILKFHSSKEWKNHFASVKNSNQLMVIDFTASWCPPCRFMAPIFDKLAQKYTDVIFVKIDVDELPDVSQEFEVQAMPTFILYKEGKVVDQVVGADEDELDEKIVRYKTPAATATTTIVS